MSTGQLSEGQILIGTITGIQHYGVFVKLTDGCSGLIHITELESVKPRLLMSNLQIGQPLEVKIIKLNTDKSQAILHVPRENRQSVTAADYETQSGFSGLKKMLPLWIFHQQNK